MFKDHHSRSQKLLMNFNRSSILTALSYVLVFSVGLVSRWDYALEVDLTSGAKDVKVASSSREIGVGSKTPSLPGLHKVYESCNTDLLHCRTFRNIEGVHDQNRCITGYINKWANPKDLENAVFRYGLPAEVEHKVTIDVGERINLSDLVSFLLTQFDGDVSNYMEMGVSVGKTLFQVLTINCRANVVAFDVEKINPTFEKLLEPAMVRSKSKPEEKLLGHEFNSIDYDSPKKDDCTLNTYDQGLLRGNNFYYLNCDEFDNVGWNRMEQLVATFPTQSYQVIFSDALHTEDAISFEIDRIFQHNLLNKDHFAYVWDDMGTFVPPFCERIVNYASPNVRHKISCIVAELPGWFGNNEYDHTIAIITTLDIHDIVFMHMKNVQIIRNPE